MKVFPSSFLLFFFHFNQLLDFELYSICEINKMKMFLIILNIHCSGGSSLQLTCKKTEKVLCNYKLLFLKACHVGYISN